MARYQLLALGRKKRQKQSERRGKKKCGNHQSNLHFVYLWRPFPLTLNRVFFCVPRAPLIHCVSGQKEDACPVTFTCSCTFAVSTCVCVFARTVVGFNFIFLTSFGVSAKLFGIAPTLYIHLHKQQQLLQRQRQQPGQSTKVNALINDLETHHNEAGGTAEATRRCAPLKRKT